MDALELAGGGVDRRGVAVARPAGGRPVAGGRLAAVAGAWEDGTAVDLVLGTTLIGSCVGSVSVVRVGGRRGAPVARVEGHE